MKTTLLNETFIDALKQKIPENSSLINKLKDVLIIEKEAVYRRLRGDVLFTFAEIVKISKELSISLDTLVQSTSKNRPLQFALIDYTNPTELDYILIDQFLDRVQLIGESAESELGDVSNIIPEPLYYNFPYLNRYCVFKGHYHRSYGKDTNISFRDLKPTERIISMQRRHLRLIKNIKHSFYIWDPWIFQYLVNDIKSFESIGLVTKEDIVSLKQDLNDFLNHIEKLAAKGYYEDTGNQFSLYISEMNFNATYCFMSSPNYHMSLWRAFSINSLFSIDNSTLHFMMNWVNSFKRLSTLISVSGGKNRISFFNKQKQVIEQL